MTLTYKKKLDQAMLVLQTLIDEQYEENDVIQTAFNDLACALDDVVE